MPNSIEEAVIKAANLVVADFQKYPSRYWNERDLHWSLFFYLRQQQVVSEQYPTQLIRAEFPTLNKFDGQRGHYDLVVLDAQSYWDPKVQALGKNSPWEEYLELIYLAAAIEVKAWQSAAQPARAQNLIEWDMRKLTEQPHKVCSAYFLNFVSLDLKRPHHTVFYSTLRGLLEKQKALHGQVAILCVPSERSIPPDPNSNWL